MCGIFGIHYFNSPPLAEARQTAETLCTALRHRGPNDYGWNTFSAAGNMLADERSAHGAGHEACALLLGQTRLSIIDLTSAGHQPMSSPDGRYFIVFNGEIYNYKELREELQNSGVVFRTQTDTEVLLQALIRWGESCLQRIIGMFVFAFYDSRLQTLLCARDAFGIKPFYWTQGQQGFCFASELPALLTIPGVSRRLDWNAAFNFLAVGREGVGGETFVGGVFQLPPAYLLRVDLRSGRVAAPERWWRVPLGEATKLTFDEAAEELRRLFLQSVALHMRSDVPVGVALSGGIDSSAVICCIRHLYPDFPLHAFSYIANEDASISEEYWIKLAANCTGAALHTTSPQADFLEKHADEVFCHLNEPFSSSGLMAQYQVNRLAAENGVTVVLNGEGGDETLGGYYGYPDERIRTLLGRGDLAGAVRFFHAISKRPGQDKKHVALRLIKSMLPAWAEPLGRTVAGKPLFPSWLNAPNIKEHAAGKLLSRDSGVYPSPDKVRATLANSLTWAGCPNLLRYGDRCASAFSLENRVPFLTIPLVTFCLSLPEHYLVSMEGETKSVFRKAMRGIVPDVLLDRRDKIGFESPEKIWLCNAPQWVESILETAKHSALFNADEVTALWRQVFSEKKRYDSAIWRILSYLRWKTLLRIEE